MNKLKALGSSAIALYFIIGLEIMIMISPFAGLFYSAFNPFLLATASNPATRWLSAFYLPHMVVPPDDFLKSVRIAGSALFVAGLSGFLACAVQVYANKFMKKGAALNGLYSYIRHPQYVMLGVSGLGLAILWPRFLVAALWFVMVVFYYFLSKDEERRMLKDYPDSYAGYMERTGMFLPRRVEGLMPRLNHAGRVVAFALLGLLVIGGAFALRAYTVSHLPLWSAPNAAVLAIMPDDMQMLDHRMAAIMGLPEVKARLRDDRRYLVYFMPRNYIMQGLIADTGGDWRLYKQHHTLGMITDWVFHPFRHLSEHHHLMDQHAEHDAGQPAEGGVVRRLIYLEIPTARSNDPSELFSINAKRLPVFMLDVDVHSLLVIEIKDLPADTGWGSVPTHVF